MWVKQTGVLLDRNKMSCKLNSYLWVPNTQSHSMIYWPKFTLGMRWWRSWHLHSYRWIQFKKEILISYRWWLKQDAAFVANMIRFPHTMCICMNRHIKNMVQSALYWPKAYSRGWTFNASVDPRLCATNWQQSRAGWEFSLSTAYTKLTRTYLGACWRWWCLWIRG